MTEKNTVLDIAGTAAVMMACVDEYKPDVEKKILLYPRSVLPDMWIPFGFVLGGQTMDWYFEQVKWSENETFEELDRESASVNNDNLFFLPFFAGRICPSDSSFTGDWIGLKFYHKRAHMFKSIMESIGYEYRFYLSRIKELFPEIEVKEIVTSAGGAKSEVFAQTKADILNIPFVPLIQKDTSHKAAAIIAGYGTGLYSDMAETAKKMSRNNEMVRMEPDVTKNQKYNASYRKYLEIVSYMEKFHENVNL